MNGQRLLIALLTLGWSLAASAHRLDQYLEATTIAIAKDHLSLQLRLTPGVAVTPQLLGFMGVAADGTLSPIAQAAYSRRVRDDLSLTIDGTAVPLRLTASTYPTVAAMRSGLGDIVLDFDAPLPSGGSGRHRLAYDNAHESRIAVYLVNCLLPDDRDIAILEQSRNVDQSRYQLNFSIQDIADAPRIVAPHGLSKGGWAVIETFFFHGVGHILTGYDHLLFACALVLAVTSVWDLIKVVTAFTLAHSITLTLAVMGLVRLPPHIVEPVIAGSIVFVAVQNIFWSSSARGCSRLAAAFVFGLFHGLGFAGGLLDLMHQMPKATVMLAILGFSVGVEIGHQIVLLPLFGALRIMRRARDKGLSAARRLATVQRAGSAAIAAAGFYYLGLALVG